MKNKTDKQYENEHNDEVTLHSLIKALGLLMEAKELLDKADWHNAKDEWMGDIPVMSIEIQEQAHNLKKLLGVPVDAYDTELFSIGQTPAFPKSAKAELIQEDGYNPEDETLDETFAHKPIENDADFIDACGLRNKAKVIYANIDNHNLDKALSHISHVKTLIQGYIDPFNGLNDEGAAEKSATPVQPNDSLGLHSAVDDLYIAIEKDDLETALKYVNWMEDVARSYADPRSEAHDHLNLFEQMQALYSAINAENKSEANEVIHTISDIADKGIKDAHFDNEFEKEWNASNKQ